MSQTIRVPDSIYEALRDVSERHGCTMAEAARLALNGDDIREVSLRAQFRRAKQNEDWERAETILDQFFEVTGVGTVPEHIRENSPPATSRDDFPENALELDKDIDPEDMPET